MKKRLKKMHLHLLLILLAIIVAPVTVSANGTKIGDLCYNLDGKNLTAEVTYENSTSPRYTSLPSALTIPGRIEYSGKTYTVTSIGYAAFNGCSGLESINISDKVISIDSSAFSHCSGLTSIKIPTSVTSIAALTFDNCTSLKSIFIPGTVTSIGEYAFRNCTGLTSINIPTSVTSIKYAAFTGCSGLTSIVIPPKVTAINSDTFNGCIGLASVDIPASVTKIGNQVFYGCSGLTSVTIPSSVAQMGHNVFTSCENLTTLICYAPTPPTCDGKLLSNPENTTLFVLHSAVDVYKNASYWSSIGEIKSFNKTGDLYYKPNDTNMTAEVTYENSSAPGYSNLPSDLTIPETVTFFGKAFRVTSIGNSAFSRCTGLTSVTIPNSVSQLGEYAFASCENLMTVTCNALTPPACDSSVFTDLQNATLLVPNAVLDVYKSTSPWSTFTTIRAYNKIGEICYNLTNSSLTAEVTCENSTSPRYTSLPADLTIPETIVYSGKTYTVTSIGEEAFDGYSGLTSVTIPNSVTQLDYHAFGNCDNLTTVTCFASTPPICTDDILTNPENATLFVPASALDAYQKDNYWGSFGSIEVFNKIGELCYNFDNAGLTAEVTYEESESPRYESLPSELTIPETVTYSGNTYMVTSIGTNAFSGCTGLTSVVIPNSVTCIDEQAFIGAGLTSIDIPTSVTSIGSWAFASCNALTSIDIPGSVTSIDNHTFAYCKRLTSIDIPGSVTSIGTRAFYYCPGLTSVTIPGSVSQMGSETFADCNNLTTVTCLAMTPPTCSGEILTDPQSATLIVPSSALEAYKSATYWSRFGTIKAIEEAAKIGELCYNLNNSNLTAEVTYENSSYPRYPSLPADLTIPATVTYSGNTYTVTSIGGNAFYGCSDLKSINIPTSVTSISGGAFMDCSGLTSINIPTSVTSIGAGAFQACTGLTSINIPGSVTSIAEKTFRGCTGLTSINIPNSVTSIGERAFRGCTGLTSVIIPSLVTQLGYYAFGNCDNLTTVTCFASTPPTCTADILTNPGNATLLVPAPALDEYKSTSPWSSFGTIKAIGDTPTGVTDLNVDISGYIVTSAEGVVTIKGLDPTEVTTCYDLNGAKLGETTASDGVASFNATPGSIVIVRIGNAAIKVAVK